MGSFHLHDWSAPPRHSHTLIWWGRGTATLYAYKIFGRKDLVQVQSSLAAQMHEEKLGVGAVSFLNEKVEGSR